MINIKKKIIFITIAIIAVAAISVGTVFTFKLLKKNNTSTSKTTRVTKAQADATKEKATKAVSANDIELAKTLLKTEIEQYKQLGDMNAVIDAQSQLYLVEHSTIPTKVTVKTAQTGSSSK